MYPRREKSASCRGTNPCAKPCPRLKRPAFAYPHSHALTASQPAFGEGGRRTTQGRSFNTYMSRLYRETLL